MQNKKSQLGAKGDKQWEFLQDGEEELDKHIFVIKIWFEEIDEKSGEPCWRGSIKHISADRTKNSKVCHFRDFDQIVQIIMPYLKKFNENVTKSS